MKNIVKHKGYLIEARFSIDDGRTWKQGGFHTSRQTWFPPTDKGLVRACETADSIVGSLRNSSKLAVVISEEDGEEVYSAQYADDAV